MSRRNRVETAPLDQVQRAVALINIGARSHVIFSETNLSKDHVYRLYNKITGKPSSKGLSPHDPEWFMPWQHNIHASLFANIYADLNIRLDVDQIDVTIRAYELYLECVKTHGMRQVLSFSRAWQLVRCIDTRVLKWTACGKCGYDFVTYTYILDKSFVCGLCNPPARAGMRGV